jgi:tRNA-splicing ligase RtcB
VSRITRENRDKAWQQLGTSGSGNHFVEYGTLTIGDAPNELNLEPGNYLALLSHSGSRGTGASVCSTYSNIARQKLPARFAELGRLAWLELESQEGQEYWLAMNLMGDYAAANHAVIHRNVTRRLGAQIVAGVENHHNFAWLEEHQGRMLVVHRKGATPAGKGVLGVIPGSMGDPAFVVRGKGSAASLDSASHGAGRRMSRTAAKAKFNFNAVRKQLAQRGIQVLSAGADEVPGVYKNILEVMSEQQDLVETVARFDPRLVKMCGDGSRAED